MDYSNADMGDMRREALRRTREIHRQKENDSDENFQYKDNGRISSESRCGAENRNDLSGLFSKLFSGGKPDSDKLILIVLIIILAGDGADIKLLLALGYILL